MELDEILNDSHDYKNPFDEDDDDPAEQVNTIETAKPTAPVVAPKPSLPVIDAAPPVPPRRTALPPPSTAGPARPPTVTVNPAPAAPAPTLPSAQSRPVPPISQTQLSPAPTVPIPRTLPPREALEQRLVIYRGSVVKCQSSGDDRRARQNERIVKQFEQALKDLARGKPIDWTSLPTPVGCSAIAGVSDGRVSGF